MPAFAYLRHPITLLTAVSLTIAFVWYALGLPEQMPASAFGTGEKLDCVRYVPASGPDGVVPPAVIEADLTRIAPYAACIRTDRTGAGLDRLPAIAARLGLTVLQGVAITGNPAENRTETDRAVNLAGTYRASIRAFVVGSDVLTYRTLRPSEYAALVRQVRDATRLPVTASETPEIWIDADLLAAAVDFITLRVPLYESEFPVAPSAAARKIVDARNRIAAAFPKRSISIVETGWPSAGRMRGAALPSAAAQARVLHDVASAARKHKFQLVVQEAIDRPDRAAIAGTAAAHWGLIEREAKAPKFRWGGTVANFPLWFMQGTTGVLFALVIFAAAFLSARSAGMRAPTAVKWEPVALMAAGAGITIGWAIAELPLQGHSVGGWALGLSLLLLALAVPPLCAAAVVRGIPHEGFAPATDPDARHGAKPLSIAIAAMLSISAILAIAVSLALVFDPEGRDFPFAALTGPAVALLVLSMSAPPAIRREGVAERGAALVLAVSALLIVISESLQNWQALWLASALAALAYACWRAAGARTR